MTLDSGQVDDGATGTLTFTLTNAVFGSSLLPSDLDFSELGAACAADDGTDCADGVASGSPAPQGDTVAITIQSGGGEGDDFVEFGIQTMSDGDGNNAVLEPGDLLQFGIHEMKVVSEDGGQTGILADPSKSVGISATFQPVASSGTNDFAFATASVASESDAFIAGSDYELDVSLDETTSDIVIDGAVAHVIGTATILENGRGVIADGVTNLDISVWESISLTISGPFRSGDTGFVDLDGDGVVDLGEEMIRIDDTTLSLELFGNTPVTSARLIFMPSRAGPRLSRFEPGLAVNWDDPTYLPVIINREAPEPPPGDQLSLCVSIDDVPVAGGRATVSQDGGVSLDERLVDGCAVFEDFDDSQSTDLVLNLQQQSTGSRNTLLGCLSINHIVQAASSVVLTQNQEDTKLPRTDALGCFRFVSYVGDKSGEILIQLD